MSFMSVPAIDRLLEPSKTESTSVQPWNTRADKKNVTNMSPLFPSQPHAQSSMPQSRPSLPTFPPTPYILNFKQQVFDENGTSNSIVEASRYDLDVAKQCNGSPVHEVASSFRDEDKLLSKLKNKVINNKSALNDDGMLPIREIQDHLSSEGKSWEGKERSHVKKIHKNKKLMTNHVIKKVETTYNGHQKQESGKGSRCQSPSVGQYDMDFSSISLSNQEEFFDAPEEPFEGGLFVFYQFA